MTPGKTGFLLTKKEHYGTTKFNEHWLFYHTNYQHRGIVQRYIHKAKQDKYKHCITGI